MSANPGVPDDSVLNYCINTVTYYMSLHLTSLVEQEAHIDQSGWSITAAVTRGEGTEELKNAMILSVSLFGRDHKNASSIRLN